MWHSVAVQAGSGDDQVVVLAPAPNAAVWNVAVSVDGEPQWRQRPAGGGDSGFDRHGALPADGLFCRCADAGESGQCGEHQRGWNGLSTTGRPVGII